LPVEELRAPSQFPQRDAGGIAHDVAGPGPQRRQPGDQAGGRVPGERARRSSGPVRISAPAWLIVWVRSERALRAAGLDAFDVAAPGCKPTWPGPPGSRKVVKTV
jgi:hypothetical protein